MPSAPVTERRAIATSVRNAEVKRAVKEALDDKRLDDMGVQLTNLGTQMTQGFAEVHTRLDTVNGRVGTSEKRIDAIEGKDNYDKIIWVILTTLIGIVVFFVTKQ